jgi:Tol biopolymer transport system component
MFFRVKRWFQWGLGLGLMGLVAGCSAGNYALGPTSLNSRFNDEQPSLSGNGRLLAFVSNRNQRREILLYDLELKRFLDLPGLNKPGAIAENPSLSYNGRYIVYIGSEQGRPELQLYDRISKTTQILSMGYRGWIRNPSISPDGRYISFESSNQGNWHIEVFDRGNVELDIPDGTPSVQK